MSVLTALTTALGALTLLTAGLAVAIAARRGLRRAAATRHRRASAPLRPLVVELAAGDAGEVSAAVDRFARLDPRTWSVVEPAVVALLSKVRGESRDGVVTVLAARGVLARAGRDLHRSGALRRARAAELLGRARERGAVHQLLVLLDDRDPEVRPVAARALGRIGAPRAAGPLLSALGREHHALPVTVVAQALLRIGLPGAPAVAVSLMASSGLVRTTAADVLGRLGAAAAHDRLVDALAHDGSDEVRAAAATALGRLGLPGSAGPLLAVAGEGAVPRVRLAARQALAALGLGDLPAPTPFAPQPVGARA